ncbi:putative maltase-glucoamylase 2 [Babylonia areolata]|uniref:putative maltase-glucoamylase 2 n=1 Tax=Babylonia areolata TaxID=304850 RepID=UPI003FD6390F
MPASPGLRPGRKGTAAIIIVGVIILIAVLTPIAYFASMKKDEEAKEEEVEVVKRSGRVDCYPERSSPAVTLTREACEARGCEFDEEAAADNDLGVPCYYSSERGVQYSVSREEEMPWGTRLHLKVNGTSPFRMDFIRPVLDVHMLSDQLVRFTFDDVFASPPRYRVPLPLDLPERSGNSTTRLYEFRITDRSKLSFVIIRKSTGTIIFDTGVGGLVLSEQFLQLSSKLPSANVYGMGEHSRPTFRRQFNSSNAWPAFTRDEPPAGGPAFLMQPPGVRNFNLYGVHPFYTCVEDDKGNTHGVFLLNSNAQEYEFSPGPMLTWRTIGGVLDLFLFMGPSPENVVQQYTQLIGRPMMPPYWALGFQLCRYGYNSLANLQRAVNDTLKYNIPLDVQYGDIDHYDDRKVFTIDPVNFDGLSEYFDKLREGGMRIIIILDPGIISNETNYAPYEEMKKVKANVRWPDDFDVPEGSADTDGSMFGYVWPKGKVVFPDYFKEETRKVWKDLIVKHHKNLTFDGLWIDMNEPSNFGTNEQKPWNWPEDARPYWSLQCGNNRWDEPNYRPLAAHLYDTKDKRKRISDKTLCMNGVQGQHNEYRHYDVHSLYGWSQTRVSLESARAATGERSVVISRSTFAGSGKYAGHWLGDNTSIWSHLAESIIGMLDFNLFGIPYNGADICGFFRNATEELCLRWMQLGAFYPFSRNHNSIDNKDQDPGVFGDTVADASREILETRYWLLPYLYTLFHQAHTLGRTVVRPLHHEFPTDKSALGIDRQFLWGPTLLISPILEQDQKQLRYYLPEGRWYQFYTGEMSMGPAYKSVAVNLTSKPDLHLRGGHVIVMQRPANNTHFSRQNGFEIRAMLDKADTEGGTANGSLFWDDGTSVDTYENGGYFLANYDVSNQTLRVTVVHNNETAVRDVSTLQYENVIVHGVTSATDVTVTISSTGAKINNTFDMDKSLQMLNITLDGTVPLGKAFTVKWQ